MTLKAETAAKTKKKRLKALRTALKRRGLSGFLVPHADEHQSEYLPAQAQRLRWLAGFTGSAGMVIVLEYAAAIFTDGRYTLQVHDEVDEALFNFFHLTDEPPTDWLAENLPQKSRLGYDPWLHTPDQVSRFQEACKKKGVTLTPVKTNPIDDLWDDQPAAPQSPIIAHEVRFSGLKSSEKRRAIAKTLAKDGLDGAFLSAPESIAWLLNIRGNDIPHAPLPLAFALIASSGSVLLFVDKKKTTPGLDQHLGKDVQILDPATLGPTLDEWGSKKKHVSLDGARDPSWVFDRLHKAGAKISRQEDPCLLPKACKNKTEISGIRSAHRRDGAALCRFFCWLKGRTKSAAITEIGAKQKLDALRGEVKWFQEPSFSTISAAGPNAAIVHYQVTEETDRRLENGCLYLVDSGGQYLDGTTDVTRTLSMGTPSPEMRDRFTRVLKGHMALSRAVFPKGTTGAQLDVLARQSLWAVGLDYDHGTGHGVGCYLSVHEGPQRISAHPSKVALEVGMVLSNEPGYYKAGAYGIRIENLLVVVPIPAPKGGEKDLLGFEPLTLAPIDLSLVEPALLDTAEIKWLNTYHQRVRDEIIPLVDDDTGRWLMRATGSIGDICKPCSDTDPQP
jgi:Xaa-Pro aminopeptidase